MSDGGRALSLSLHEVATVNWRLLGGIATHRLLECVRRWAARSFDAVDFMALSLFLRIDTR